ncbi:TonB-dependent receptor [Sphingomonas sp.]|uniref:TonB-dependent receptor n=1 Tax=Sphingomonas sp. TaxID=28214 RepID=UPI0028A72EB6|nr:TonB-dependent receptor [Sphingomonas sp.]
MIRISIATLLASTSIAPAFAQATANAQESETILVVGQRDLLALEARTQAGSRLPLTARETPATVEVITQDELQLRGLRTAREAFNDVAGAVSGNVPGNPAVISLRGFSGNAVSILQDGVRISTSTVVQRDSNTWHYDRIEVLKGPASVLYGEGALAGVINKVTRKPTLDGRRFDSLLSGGSFGTLFAAAGANLPLSAKIALRADASYRRSDSLYDVDNNGTMSAGLTASLLFRPSDRLTVLVAIDHFEDRYDATYQGLPLIPRAYARDPSDAVSSVSDLVADRALRHRNYNPQGAFSNADETTARARVDWRLARAWTLALDLTGYTAKRAFVLSDDQHFLAPTAAFPNGSFRQSFQDFRHDHRFANLRATIVGDTSIAGMRNRISLGAEANHTDFETLRQETGQQALPPIDVPTPRPSPLPTGRGIFDSLDVTFRSKLNQVSLFGENALNLTPRWLVVGGVRWDHIALTRTTVANATGSTDRNAPSFDPVTWRVGTTYAVRPELTLYAQYTTAVSPVSSILLASIANSRFRLTQGHAYEAGFKASGANGRFDVTGAVFRIEQRDILTRDPANPALAVQGGRQSAQGAELSAAMLPSPRLRLTAGLSYTDARYDMLAERVGGVRVDRSGNRPINVPATTVNATALYKVTDAITVGGFARHAGSFMTDTANAIRVAGHTVVDASIAWRVRHNTTLTFRGRNLTNAFYGEFSGYPSTNVYIGAPRSFEIALAVRI